MERDFTELEASFADMRKAFTGFYCERYEIDSSGSFIGCRTEMGGVFEAPFDTPFGTVQPHGGPFSLSLNNMFRYDDAGKLAGEWVQYDNLEMMRQLRRTRAPDVKPAVAFRASAIP